MRRATLYCCIICILAFVLTPATLTAERQLPGSISLKGPPPGVLRVSSSGSSGPRLVVYWDAALTQRTTCLSAGDTVTVYIAAENVPGSMDRIEYCVQASPYGFFQYVSETVEIGSSTGGFNAGITIDFSPSADASGQLLLQTMRFAVLEACSPDCSSDISNRIYTTSHPSASGVDAVATISGGDEIVVYCHQARGCDDDGMPDLEIVSFTSPDTAMIYEDLEPEMILTIRNSGPDSMINYHTIDMTLTGDTTTTEGIRIWRQALLAPLGAGATSTVPMTGARIPLSAPTGQRYLCLNIDYSSSSAELDESDNIIWHPVIVEPDPSIDTTYVYAEDFQEGPAGWTAVDLNIPESHIQNESYLDGAETRDVLWCGTDDASYATPPGYGDNWNEGIYKQFTLPSEAVSLSYMIQYDTEPGYDFVYVQISTDGENYTDLRVFDGSSGGFTQFDEDISAYAGQTVWIKFQFISDSAYSDEDGYYPSDGAMRLDWVFVTGYTQDDFTSTFDGWSIYAPDSPGGEFRLEYDPHCDLNVPCELNVYGDPQVVCNAWVAYDPATGVFPYGEGGDVWVGIDSPAIPVPQDAIDVILEFDVYYHLPLGTDVYCQWQVAFPPDWTWTGDGMLSYGTGGWSTRRLSLSEYIPPGATEMKIRLTGRETNIQGGTLPHTPAPYFDNVGVYGIRTTTAGVDVSTFPRDCSWSDGDWDGVGDLTDTCPSEDSAPFDRDGDGCIDGAIGSRHMEYYSPDTLWYSISSAGVPGISDGSDLQAVINGFEAWNAIGGTDITGVYDGSADEQASALDGLNTVTFTDPDYHFPVGVLAVGISTSFVEPDRYREEHVRPGQIVDADIMFNPNMSFGTPTAGSGTDIQSVATHEAGHLFGISHSAVQTSTMFFVLPPETEASTLETEDVITFRKAYADETVLSGASRLQGTVTDGETGQPVPGGIVFAIDAATGDTLASGYTMEDGTFDFLSLPDGEYYVSIHPLNGSSIIGYLQAQNVNQYIRDIFVDLFVPEYYDDAESSNDDASARTAVAVTSGNVTSVDIVTNIDETGPVVTETSPAPGDSTVMIDASVLISFSEPIDPATIQGNFTLRDTLSGEAIGGNAAMLDDDSTLAFIPSNNLGFEKVYELSLGTGLSDKFGNGLSAPFSMLFKTELKPDVGITSIMPRKGVETAVAVIGGYGFESEAAGNLVDFNGTEAVILEASATKLVVEVPEGTSTGNVTVENLAEGKVSNALTFTLISAEEVARGYDAGTAPLGTVPRAMSVSPDGATLFVATEDGYSAVAADPGSAGYLSTRAFPVEGGLDGIDVTPDGKRAYGISRANGKLYRINAEPAAGGLEDLQILSEIETSAEPLGILIEPAGRRAYVATSDNTVEIIDIYSNSATFEKQIGSINSLGVSLRGNMAIDPSGGLLLVLSGSGEMAVFDVAGDTLAATVSVGLDPRDVAVDPAGRRAYVTDENGVAAVVSLEMLEKVADVPTGGSLRGDAVTPAGSFLFSVNRELNFYDVIDLRQTSQSFRSVVANIALPVNPVDVDLSPNGQYAFSICEQDMSVAVTAIGIGPTIHTISPAAGPEGAKVVISGEGFSSDSTVAVSFNGITVDPEVRRDEMLVVSVPPGDATGPVMVVGSNPFRPDALSNEVYFNKLSGSPNDGFRLAGEVDVDGLDGEAGILTGGGCMCLVGVTSGPDMSLCAIDTDHGSETFLQILGAYALPAGYSVDRVVATPDGDLAIVMDRGAGKVGEPDDMPLVDIGRLSPSFMTATGSIDVAGMTQGVSGVSVSPAGDMIVIAEEGDPQGAPDAAIHIYRPDSSGEAAFIPEGSISVAGTPVRDPVFHPGGLYCYLPVADPGGPHISVLDTDRESPTYMTLVGDITVPGTPAAPLPVSMSFSPDGAKCLVLVCEEGGTEERSVMLIDTSDPSAPAVDDIEPLGGSVAGAGHIDVSPAGSRAVASFEEGGLFHLDLATEEDSCFTVGQTGGGIPPVTSGDYKSDGTGYYCVSPGSDLMSIYDFSDAHSLAASSGNGQSGIAGTELQAELRVRVESSTGAGIEGVPVTFAVTGGSGLFAGNGGSVRTVATDGDGRAGVSFILGPEVGTQTVSASSPGLAGSPVVFSSTSLEDPETLPLQFVETAPYDSMTGVSTTSAARLTFSRPVDPATVDTTACYMLEAGASEPVPAVIGFSDGFRRVSIMPREPLEFLTEYTLAVTGGVADAAGGALENPGSKVFTTSDPPPLEISAISPPSGLTGVQAVISGCGFDRDIADNTVYFNDRTAGVTEASDDHLTVIVPYDAVNGNAVVRVETATQTSNALSFNVLVPQQGAIDEEVLKKVGTGSATRSVVVTPDGALMYAVSPAVNSVIVIDIVSLSPLASIPVGENPFAIALDPEASHAYVTNFLDHTVSVINTQRFSPGFNTVEETIEVGMNPIDALVTPEGNRLVVSNLGSMDLSIIDADESSETYNMVLASVGTGQTTRAMTVTPDGGLLYIGTSDGYLVVSVVDFGVLKTVGTGSSTKSVTVTPDGALLVLLTAEGEVLFVDIAEGSPSEDQVVGRVGAGSAVKSVTVTPDGGLLYLVLDGMDAILTVSLERISSAEVSSGAEDMGMDLVQATVIDTIYSGEDPAEVAFAPGGSDIAVITNAGDNSVSIYNPGGGPIGIEISDFCVKSSRDDALIEWRSNLEYDISGFEVLRSEQPLSGFEKITEDPVRAMGIPSTYSFRDGTVRPGHTYYYRLEAVDGLGRRENFGPVEFVCVARFALYQNVPNPFNPETTIRFTVPEAGPVDLRIYDVAGRLVRTLVEGNLTADRYEVRWDGTNNGGRKVSSGVYFYRIKAGRHEKTRKMVLLR